MEINSDNMLKESENQLILRTLEKNRPRDLDSILVKPGAKSQVTMPRHVTYRTEIRVQMTELCFSGYRGDWLQEPGDTNTFP